jgi:hypothetical protein
MENVKFMNTLESFINFLYLLHRNEYYFMIPLPVHFTHFRDCDIVQNLDLLLLFLIFYFVLRSNSNEK